MATIKPFRAYRPIPEYAAQVASLPYDVVTTAEARASASQNPYSFLHVVRAEIDLEPQIDSYAPEVYAKAAENLHRLIAEQILVQDQQACLYVYRERLGKACQTGVVACTPIADYRAGTIKIHEHTRPDKVRDRMRYIEACGAHTGLIFLTYRRQPQISQLVASWITSHAPVYDFTSDDAVCHTVWVIDAPDVIAALMQAFVAVEALYVADGHHRAEAASEFARMARQRSDKATGDDPWDDFQAVLFPCDELTILDYNRVVKDLDGLEESEFLRRLEEHFEITRYDGAGPYRPDTQHMFGMYLGHTWYVLRAKPGSFRTDDPVDVLDAAILQKNLLGPILAIHDPRTNTRIDFVGGIRGLEELVRLVDSGDYQVAFAMYPTTIDEVLAVADAGQIMFPKSTWFEPKLRGGLFVHGCEV